MADDEQTDATPAEQVREAALEVQHAGEELEGALNWGDTPKGQRHTAKAVERLAEAQEQLADTIKTYDKEAPVPQKELREPTTPPKPNKGKADKPKPVEEGKPYEAQESNRRDNGKDEES